MFKKQSQEIDNIKQLLEECNQKTNDSSAVVNQSIKSINDKIDSIKGEIETSFKEAEEKSDGRTEKIREELKGKIDKIDELESQYIVLENKLDKKLNDFYKEFTDRYFETLSTFLRWNKEITLVDHLSKGGDINLSRLKKELERPMVEEEWAKKHAQETTKINQALSSQGEKIRKAWERYKDEKLSLERQGKDTKFVDAKLEVLNVLMGR